MSSILIVKPLDFAPFMKMAEQIEAYRRGAQSSAEMSS
jgi:hypothetical protein